MIPAEFSGAVAAAWAHLSRAAAQLEPTAAARRAALSGLASCDCLLSYVEGPRRDSAAAVLPTERERVVLAGQLEVVSLSMQRAGVASVDRRALDDLYDWLVGDGAVEHITPDGPVAHYLSVLAAAKALIASPLLDHRKVGAQSVGAIGQALVDEDRVGKIASGLRRMARMGAVPDPAVGELAEKTRLLMVSMATARAVPPVPDLLSSRQ